MPRSVAVIGLSDETKPYLQSFRLSFRGLPVESGLIDFEESWELDRFETFDVSVPGVVVVDILVAADECGAVGLDVVGDFLVADRKSVV